MSLLRYRTVATSNGLWRALANVAWHLNLQFAVSYFALNHQSLVCALVLLSIMYTLLLRFFRVAKMPFKFHLKKSRQYNVVSKNQYVICVELLDSSSIECTLSIDSSGQECLNNVTQRIGLGQPEFFGLRFICCHGTPSLRWIDMDKPLKKQLEKDAKSFTLYLRVMHYITDIQFIQDDITRCAMLP